jgi:uncharacterized protein YbjT (DUF2867 family)
MRLPKAAGRHEQVRGSALEVFIIGITGAVGALLLQELEGRGDGVSGLVRREDQRADLARRRVKAHVGDIGAVDVEALALLLEGCDALVYTAGSNGGSRPSRTPSTVRASSRRWKPPPAPA